MFVVKFVGDVSTLSIILILILFLHSSSFRNQLDARHQEARKLGVGVPNPSTEKVQCLSADDPIHCFSRTALIQLWPGHDVDRTWMMAVESACQGGPDRQAKESQAVREKERERKHPHHHCHHHGYLRTQCYGEVDSTTRRPRPVYLIRLSAKARPASCPRRPPRPELRPAN